MSRQLLWHHYFILTTVFSCFKRSISYVHIVIKIVHTYIFKTKKIILSSFSHRKYTQNIIHKHNENSWEKNKKNRLTSFCSPIRISNVSTCAIKSSLLSCNTLLSVIYFLSSAWNFSSVAATPSFIFFARAAFYRQRITSDKWNRNVMQRKKWRRQKKIFSVNEGICSTKRNINIFL